jgi:hypothetical protein
MICKLILLFALVLYGGASLCKCPKKPEKWDSIDFCGKHIHRDCNNETIYSCGYRKGGQNITVRLDCGVMGNKCRAQSCPQQYEMMGNCHLHICI